MTLESGELRFAGGRLPRRERVLAADSIRALDVGTIRDPQGNAVDQNRVSARLVNGEYTLLVTVASLRVAHYIAARLRLELGLAS